MIRYSILLDGKVQGVGFRYFTQIEASRLGLTGWAKNLINSQVEIEVQGTEENVHKFVSTIKIGNRFSRVDSISLNKIPSITDEKKFTIKY